MTEPKVFRWTDYDDEYEGLLKAWRARDLARLERMEKVANTEREKYEAARQIQLTLFPRSVA